MPLARFLYYFMVVHVLRFNSYDSHTFCAILTLCALLNTFSLLFFLGHILKKMSARIDSGAHMLSHLLQFVFRLLLCLVCACFVAAFLWLLLWWWHSRNRYGIYNSKSLYALVFLKSVIFFWTKLHNLQDGLWSGTLSQRSTKRCTFSVSSSSSSRFWLLLLWWAIHVDKMHNFITLYLLCWYSLSGSSRGVGGRCQQANQPKQSLNLHRCAFSIVLFFGSPEEVELR